MDTTRWKSVLVPREVYDEIKTLAKNEGRTISGQLRLMFEYYKHEVLDDNGREYDRGYDNGYDPDDPGYFAGKIER